ncbi:hypothetical protein CH063_07434 [Colletotrichum higginsianum]|uniref:Uncharacterized protein n=1 Tax=Colletotrichum higginsianum (strain IMI 349063) TaxID=759273 RepID=H1V653_COLHI|nr:hypothetical protein CH063_07434 [Colletotrichum higginsianum]
MTRTNQTEKKGEHSRTQRPGHYIAAIQSCQGPFCNITLNHLLANSPKGITAFNQSLLTSLFARNLQLDLASSSTKPPPGFVLFTWKTVSVLLRANALHSHPNTNLNPLSDRLVIVLVDTSFRLEARRSPTIYQARDEAYAECNKLDDIRALDRVAQAHHTWRPKTCFGAGPYTLADVARDFKKRSWSSSSGHATTDDSKAAMLTCTTTATLRKPPSRKRQCVRRATPL